jgi:hypothetical protein
MDAKLLKFGLLALFAVMFFIATMFFGYRASKGETAPERDDMGFFAFLCGCVSIGMAVGATCCLDK